MKKLIILLALLLIPSALAYSFMNYNHETQWNDTADISTDPISYGWTNTYLGENLLYSTDNPFNGSKSLKITVGSGSAYIKWDMTATDLNYVIQYALYVNTSQSSGSSIFGVTPNHASGFYGGLIVDNNANYRYIRHDLDNGASQTSSVAKSTGWHIVQYNVTGNTNMKILVDGVALVNYTLSGTGNAGLTTIGKLYRLGVAHGNAEVFYDDMHLWNTTVVTPGSIAPSAPAILSPNATSSFIRLINITYTASTPGTGSISYYNLSLLNSDNSFNTSIVANNYLNLSYFWDSYKASSIIPGYYRVQVMAVASDTLTNATNSSLFNITTNAELNITARDIRVNTTIQNFSIRLNSSAITTSTQRSAGNVTSFNVIKGYTYTMQLYNISFYEEKNATTYVNTTFSPYIFQLYPTPSINITLLDADTSAIILQNITITVTGNGTSAHYSTTDGGLFIQNINPDTYEVELYGQNYSQSTYTVTLAQGTLYYLNAFLQSNISAENEVVMQFFDSISDNVILPDTAVVQQRIINGSWTTISNRVTDITGRTLFNYVDGVEYRFTATKTGYKVKTFELDPILFSSYSIRLERNILLNFSQDYQSASISYTPSIFYNAAQNNLNITFNSPSGTFTTYSYLLQYPGGTKNGSGTNVVGQTFNVLFNITGATYTNRVNITLNYDDTTGEEKTFRYTHAIIIAPGNTTFIANRNNTYGLGLLDRIIIGTIVIIAAAGLITIGGGATFGALIGLLLMGLWLYMGFWPWWAAGISFLVGFAVLAGRSS